MSFVRRAAAQSRVLKSFLISLAATAAVFVAILASGATAEASTYTLSSTAPVTNWSDTTKWTGGPAGTYPGQSSGDTAVVGLSGFTLNIDVNIANSVGLQVTGIPVSVSVPAAGKLMLESSSSANSNSTFTVSGGTLGTASGATIGTFNGNVTMNSGTFLSNGSLTFGQGTFTVNGGTLSGAGTIGIGSGTSATFSGSAGTMTIDSTTISNSGSIYVTSTVNQVTLQNSAQINNSGTLDFKASQTFSAGGTITNANTGTILSSGTVAPSSLILNAKVINNGGNVTTGASHLLFLDLTDTGGTYTNGGAGQINLGVATINAGTTTLSAGTSSIIIQSVALNSGAIVNGTNIDKVSNTTSGSGTLNVSGTFTWTGGIWNGPTLNLNGALSGFLSSSNALTFQSGTINNNSNLTYTGGAQQFAINNGTFVNAAGKTFDIAGDYGIGGTAGGLFTNKGTLRKSAGTGVALISVPVSNEGGTLQTQSGFLALGNGGANGTAVPASTGILDTGSNTTMGIAFSGGTFTNVSATVNGSGKLKVAGGTLALTGGITHSNVHLLSGTISGPGNLIVTSQFTWDAGTMNNGGQTTINSGGTADHVAGSTITLDNRTFTVDGTFNYNPGSPGGSELTIANGGKVAVSGTGTMFLQGDGFIFDGGGSGNQVFVSGGSFKKTGGLSTGSTRVDVPVNANAGGTIYVSNGTLDLRGGGSIGPGTLQTVNTGQSLDFSGGSFTIANTTSVSLATPVNVTGGALTNGASFSAPNGFSVFSGSLSGSGAITMPSGSTFKWLGGTINHSAGGSVTVQSGGTLTFDTSTAGISGSSLNMTANSGSNGTWVGSNNFSLLSGSLNLAGTFDMQAAANISGAGSIINTGTLKKTTSSGTMTVTPLVQNNGTLQVDAGTFSMTNGTGVSHTGVFNANGATTVIEFGGAIHTVSNGSAFQGTGTTRITNGTVTTSVPMTATNLELNGLGGLTVGVNNFGISGTTKWTAGTISGATGVVTMTGLLSLLGSGNMTASAKLAAANTTFSGSGTFLVNDTFSSSGTFDISADGSISGTGTISSSGTFKKSGGTSTSLVVPAFNNTGSVAAQSGFLRFSGNGTDTGSYDASSGANIEFFGGIRNISGSMGPINGTLRINSGAITMSGPFSVAGSFVVGGGTATINSAATANTNQLTVAGGTLTGSANFQVNPGTNNFFTGGTISGSGTFTYAAGTNLTIQGITGNTIVDGRTITNNASTTLQGTLPMFLQNGAVWNQNGGSFGIASDVGISTLGSPASSITSAVLFKKTGGTGISTVSPAFTNAGGTVGALFGTLDFAGGFTQSSGTTTAGPGTLGSTSPLGMTFNGGTLDGSGTMSTTLLTNNAAINPSGPGTINITGTYVQGSSGSLTTDLFGNASYDKLTVGSAANLAGTYTATLQGGFTPANATTFDVLTFASRSGDFATKNLPTYPSGGSMTAAYVTSPSNALRLTAVVTQADIQVSQSVPASVTHTQTATITVTVTNNGTSTATPVSVTDTFSANATFVSASITGGGTCSGTGPVTCSLASLGSGASQTMTVVLQANICCTNITNSASGSAPQFDPNTANNATATATMTVNPTADLAVSSLTDSPDPANAAQNVTYTVAVTNNGPDSSPSQSYSLSLTGGTLVSASGGGMTCTVNTATTATCSGIALGIGATRTFTVVATAQNQGGSMTLTAGVSSTTADLVPGNDNASQTTIVTAQADVQITKTLSTPLTAGQNTTYTIQVKNAGPSNAANVSVTDPLPANLTFVSNAGACTTNFPCSLGTLTAGQIVTITSTYAVAPGATGSISNTANVSATTADPNSGNNSAIATGTIGVSTDLAITKVLVGGTLTAGQNATYTINVTNNGPSTATSVGVADVTPAGLTFVSNTGGCTAPFPCAIGTLTSGQTVSITSTYAVGAGASGSISNTATVSAGTPDPNTADNSATATATVIQQADLQVTKSGPASAFPGNNVSYVINVKNNGPADAAGVTLTDPTPAGLTFVSATGACTALPCSLGTMTPGQQATITVTYTVSAAGSSVTNTATVSGTITDPVTSNNSASATTSTGCPSAPVVNLPPGGATNVPVTGSLSWSNTGAPSYNVYLGVAGSGCSTFAGSTAATSFNFGQLAPNTQYEWRVESVAPGCPTVSSSCSTFTTVASCVGQAPALIAPANGANVSSPVTFSWSSVPNAVSYTLFAALNGGASQNLGTTGGTTLSAALGDGAVTWFVVVNGVNNCAGGQSSIGSFNICSTSAAPVVAVVSDTFTNQTYTVQWDAIAGASKYEVDESLDPNFASLTSGFPKSVTTTSIQLQHTVSAATAFYYRVRAFSACGQKFGPNSLSARVVIVPLPPPQTKPEINAPAGSTTVVVQQVFIPGFPEGTLPFSVTIDQPWLSVTPLTGLLPPSGTTLTITADPANLPNGTITATIILSIGAAGAGSVSASDNKTVPVPVSVNLTTPVASVAKTPAAPTALVIPSVGHLDGINSKWQSDIRVTNTAINSAKYQLTFTPDDPVKGVKTTTITAQGGETIALDDIVKNWYGVGTLGESANGVLQVAPLDNFNRPATVDVAKAAVASSRTYNVTSSGTLGQFIPAIPLASFIGKAASSTQSPVILGLQQIAESAAYRTNVGVVEGTGAAAEVLLSVFDANSNKLLDFPLSLKANEQKQLNSFLAGKKISVTDGRIEARVLSGDGKISVYASVVDNLTGDPLLVSGVALNALTTNHYVLPGVADLNVGVASWRTDMRVFNSGTTPQSIALTFYQQNNSGAPVTQTMTVNPGETKALDNVVNSLFKLTNAGGAVHVTSTVPASLVVTGRTYNQTAAGTFGQFIPAVTSADAAAKDGKVLNVLQVEESSRYRTNIGVAEVTGKPATVEITAILPGSKAAPRITFDIGANEFFQRDVLHDMGLENVYNARIQLRVLSGEGRVAAYGSVIDMQTQDPTYVPAQ